MTSAPRSCLVLELSVQPGGSRWAELHAYTDPSHIRACLEVFCDDPCGLSAYHAIYYGARLGIWVIQAGEVSTFIDLHPFILARLPGGDAVPVRERAALLAMAGVGEDEELDSFDAFEDFTLTANWPAVLERLPKLREPRLEPGEHTSVRFSDARPGDTYLNAFGVTFGSLEAESGERIDPPFEIDGWDPRESDEDAEETTIRGDRRSLDDDLADLPDDPDDELWTR